MGVKLDYTIHELLRVGMGPHHVNQPFSISVSETLSQIEKGPARKLHSTETAG